MIAGAVLTLGAGIALGQPTDTPASDNAATPAEPADPAEPANPATPADPSTGTAAVPADPATPSSGATPAIPAAKDEPLAATAETTVEDKKAKRRQRCAEMKELKVGKPRDC